MSPPTRTPLSETPGGSWGKAGRIGRLAVAAIAATPPMSRERRIRVVLRLAHPIDAADLRDALHRKD